MPSDKRSTSASAATAEPLDILIIDDEEVVLESMTALLSRLGHRVAAVNSGEKALERLNLGLAADLIILDLNMRGLSGRRTLEKIRAIRPEVPVVVATGSEEQDARDLARRYAAVSVRQKPFSVTDLREDLETAATMKSLAGRW